MEDQRQVISILTDKLKVILMASSTGETTGRTMETKMGIIRAILMEILMDKIQEQ